MKSSTDGNVKSKWSGRLLVGIGLAALLAVVAILASVFGVDSLVDLWWFDSLGYGFYFWQRMLYRYAVFVVVTLLFFLVFFLNFWIAARSLKDAPVENDGHDRSRRRQLFHKFRTGFFWFYSPLSLALSIPIALPLFRQWERFLFFVFGSNTGVSDPFLGKDVAYYLFSFPIYTLVQDRLLLALVVLTAGLCILYMAKNSVLHRSPLDFGRGAKWHLIFLIVALFGIEIWDFMLQRNALVYDTSHRAIFDGPGYVQMTVTLPLIWACMLTLTAAAAALIVALRFRKGYAAAAVLVAVFAGVLALRHSDFLPRMVQTYIVKPNEIEKESPYISRHIRATLDAYDLREVQIRQFPRRGEPADGTTVRVDDVLRNIPVWDAETLAEVFHQLQELRSYYNFPIVSVGRYKVENRQQQVFVSPREIEFSNLPGGARNWINEHLTYTHGFGAVMTPASQDSGEAMTWYLHNIPPESPVDLNIEQPRIYYGLGRYTYSIAPNQGREMDYPKGDANVMTDYDGQGGVPISSLFRKFLFAYYLHNKNIFFSGKITDRSRLLFRRNILDRIHRLVPYLRLDQTPYVAVTHRGIYWMVDAYTTADSYPASAVQSLNDVPLNYIRNSVKIVVDAYSGSVNMYVYDDTDPFIKAYAAIYPGLFKSRDQMPAALRPHVRYPKDLFDIQMQVYAKYHQQDPRIFYQQEDLWTFAKPLEESDTIPPASYYVSLDLIESGKMDFLLLLPMFPKNRDNLRSVALAGCDPDHYGQLIIYNFPKGELVYGPAQIDALINQDPEIARQFTLWDQAGSKVVRGKMIILPVGNKVLFIQPVYLKATSRVRIPELQRIIMSEGEVVVMEESIQQAYAELTRLVGDKRQAPVEQAPMTAAPEEPTPAEDRAPSMENEPPVKPDSQEKPNSQPDAAPIQEPPESASHPVEKTMAPHTP